MDLRIRVMSHGRAFEAVLHFAVSDSTEYLIAASFSGFDTSVRAVQAAIIEGRTVQIIERGQPPIELQCLGGNYRRVDRKCSEALTHGMILSKDTIFEHNSENPIVLAPDGNIKTAVGKLLRCRYALPKEWETQYYEMIPRSSIEPLKIIANPLYKKWANLKAVRLSAEVTGEDYILSEIDSRLKAGELLIPPAPDGLPESKFEPEWDLKTYMKNNAQVLAAQLEAVRPRFVPGVDKLDPAIAEMKRVPFPTQAYVIQGVYNALQHQNSCFIGADMGTGKSIMAAGVSHLIHQRASNGKGTSILLSAPGITIPKWAKKEIKETLPDAKVRIIKSTEDAGRYLREVRNGYKPDGLEFVLVSNDRAKLGPDPWCSALWKRVNGHKHYAWHCPDCYEVLTVPNAETGEDTPAFWDALAYDDKPSLVGRKNLNGIPLTYPLRWKKKSPLKKCPHCEAKLWRPALKARGETQNKPRWYVCDIFKRLGKHFEMFIADEVHEAKAQDSGRGYAFGQMVLASKKLLALTGTLVNGKSTSIKEILWRTDPSALIKDGFDHRSGMVAWAGRYGVLKEVTKVNDVDEGVTTKKKRTQLQPVEEPGIAPHLVARYLLHKAVFMELGDLDLPLVPIREYVKFIDMDKEHGNYYQKFHDQLHDKCKKAVASGIKGAFAKFVPATINYADRPDLGANVVIGRGMDSWSLTAPKLEGYHAKERELVRTVKEEIAQGRGCVIYANYTDSYGVGKRIQNVLYNHGISSSILPSSVSPEKRVDWLAKKEQEGQKVLICNMRLVQVGLDLLPWPTIIYYQKNYDINMVRQASRRNWRIGQTEDCKVIFMVYNGTQQMSQLLNIMTKRTHAMITEGRLDNSELSQFGKDSQTSMAADLANCLAGTDIAQKWNELAEKDVDENLEIIQSDNFKQVVAQRMFDLANQTRRLCGVPEVLEERVDIKKEEQAITLQSEKIEQGQLTFGEMWANIPANAPKKTRRKKVKKAQGQISLFDIGMGQ